MILEPRKCWTMLTQLLRRITEMSKARYRKVLALKALGRSDEALKQAQSCKELMANCIELQNIIHELHASMNYSVILVTLTIKIGFMNE